MSLDTHCGGIRPRFEVEHPRVIACFRVLAEDPLGKPLHVANGPARQRGWVEELKLRLWHWSLPRSGARWPRNQIQVRMLTSGRVHPHEGSRRGAVRVCTPRQNLAVRAA